MQMLVRVVSWFVEKTLPKYKLVPKPISSINGTWKKYKPTAETRLKPEQLEKVLGKRMIPLLTQTGFGLLIPRCPHTTDKGFFLLRGAGL